MSDCWGQQLLLLPTAVYFCAGSFTSSEEPPDCCPTVIEDGQLWNIDIFRILFCMSSVTVLKCVMITHLFSPLVHLNKDWIRH